MNSDKAKYLDLLFTFIRTLSSSSSEDLGFELKTLGRARIIDQKFEDGAGNTFLIKLSEGVNLKLTPFLLFNNHLNIISLS